MMMRLACVLGVAQALAPRGTRPSGLPPLHVHVGAGKLGLALVVPSVAASGGRFAVVDTPKDPSWHDLVSRAAGQDITLRVNGEAVCAFEVAGDAVDGASLFEGSPKLVLSDDDAALGALMARASTVSCSLGPFLAPVMTRLVGLASRDEEPLVVYCCENDHGAVADLKDQLHGRATVVDCMVDRVSTARDVDAEGLRVDVRAEAWRGAIVSLDTALNRDSAPPFGGSNGASILAPKSAAASRYLSDRKLALVNGMHTTLAFATIRDADTLEPGSLPLVKPLSAGIVRKEFWHWALARSAVLLHDHGLDTVKAVHGLEDDDAAIEEVVAYAREALDRFQSADDTVARVLGGGVAKRWQGRLAVAAADFARAVADDDSGAVSRLLARYGATADAIEASLAALVEATLEACEVDYEAMSEACEADYDAGAEDTGACDKVPERSCIDIYAASFDDVLAQQEDPTTALQPSR